MIATILLMAQLSLPQSILPPPGQVVCDEGRTMCLARFEDAMAVILERNDLKVQVESQEEQLGALRLQIEEMERKLKYRQCGKVEVLPQGRRS